MKMLTILLALGLLAQPSSDGWDLFEKVKFTPRLIKGLNEYYVVPTFDSRIRYYEGKELTLEGYYMPMDVGRRNTVIISRNPYAQCFFCGGGGPESVAEVIFAIRPPRFNVDEIIKVTGILRLNENDIDHMNFILEGARVETDY